MKTTHSIFFQDARDLKEIPSESVDLVVTSPPYPMIDMWDEMFSHQNPEIQKALACGDGKQAFALMHEILDSVWSEVFRVLKDGRFACINLAEPHEESQGIDGFVGEEAYSIKPSTYDSIPTVAESIEVKMVFYEKKSDGVVFEIPEK